MSISILSGKLNDQDIEVVFESSYDSSGVENTYSIGGLVNVSQSSSGVAVSVAGYSLTGSSDSSEFKVMTFDDFKRDSAGRWATHEIIGIDKKPILEFIGPGLETISFSIFLTTMLGVEPVDELKKLRQLRDNGVVCMFTIGGNAVTANAWVITQLSETHKTYDNKGSLLVASVSVSLTEYVKLPKEE
ncbi:hypothetical protein SPSIL_009120 [Sporomusa silvacetica DSM 10669]|uniref:Phage P2 GpU n=1 Tax=Sporomusa silvacetica DSM 10669 TaxID=1123289 RepID=A0ABZ3IHE4_9FIRM|nr:phage tail protein [Sporomusa silvacetica]OZC13128.1 phage P2 GpU [Sporomusa silvacetica DSM 10669]